MTRLSILLAIFALIGIASASHLRYGSISAKKNATNPLSVTFTLTTATRRSYFGAPNVGDSIEVLDSFNCGDGVVERPSYIINNVDVQGDVMYGTATVTRMFVN